MNDETRLEGPGELVAVLPYVLGYHPKDSVVICCVNEGRLGLTMRQDIQTGAVMAEAVLRLVTPMSRARPDQVILVSFDDGVRSQPMLDLLIQAVAPMADLLDVIVVKRGSWISMQSSPPEWFPVPEASAGMAAMVVFGAVPQANRQVLVNRLVPNERSGRVKIDRQRGLTSGGVKAWAKALIGVTLTDDDVAASVEALRDLNFRDGLIAKLCPGQISDEAVMADEKIRSVVAVLPHPQEGMQDRLMDLAASVPDQHQAGVLTVLSSYAWAEGDGTVARIAVERALDCDPKYRLAQLLEQMIDLGITR